MNPNSFTALAVCLTAGFIGIGAGISVIFAALLYVTHQFENDENDEAGDETDIPCRAERVRASETARIRASVIRPLVVTVSRDCAKHGGKVAKAMSRAVFSLRSTAAAWTAGEISGRAIDAGFLHMPAMNSAKMFLWVFGVVLAAETVQIHRSLDDTEEHTPEKTPCVMRRESEREEQTHRLDWTAEITAE
jgi:hypothetical protein